MDLLEVTLFAAGSVAWVAIVVVCASRLGIGGEF
jgi:hypothetical protein